jgi:hypothetical protein
MKSCQWSPWAWFPGFHFFQCFLTDFSYTPVTIFRGFSSFMGFCASAFLFADHRLSYLNLNKLWPCNLPSILTYLLTYSWSWALLEELPILQLLKNFPAFYGTRRFITVFTRALHWSLSWARSIPSYLSKIHFNVVHPPTPWIYLQ